MDISCLISRTALVRARMPGGVRGTLSDERSYLDIFLFMVSLNNQESDLCKSMRENLLNLYVSFHSVQTSSLLTLIELYIFFLCNQLLIDYMGQLS